MTPNPNRVARFVLIAGLAGLTVVTRLVALDQAAWKYRTPLVVEEAAPAKYVLAPALLDHCRANLFDLRVIGPDSAEVGYAILRPEARSARWFDPKSVQSIFRGSQTVILIESGSERSFDAVEVTTPVPTFVLPAQVELSADGRSWSRVADELPFFRQAGVEQITLPLGRRAAAWVRVTLRASGSSPLLVTGARLRESATMSPPTERHAVRIERTEQFAGETLLTLDLGAANLSLTSLEIVASESLFSRKCRLNVRELQNGEVVEREIAHGTVYRLLLEDGSGHPAAQLSLALNGPIDRREVLLHIENGDSPPLHINEVVAQRQAVYLVIAPRTAGNYQILTGNPRADRMRYDVMGFINDFGPLRIAPQPIGGGEINPEFHEVDPLAGLVFEGGQLDAAPWRIRREVRLAGLGPHQLELDLPVLAAVRDDFGDLRLLQGDRQVPYLLERTSLFRALSLTPVPTPDVKRRAISRWKVELPQAGVPFSRLSLTSASPLFRRLVRVYEKIVDSRGETYEQTLGGGEWIHAPGAEATSLSLPLSSVAGKTVWIETDNGDNPPIALTGLQAFYPVTRINFQVMTAEPVELLYGNGSASVPRYDLGLVAERMASAEKKIAILGEERDGQSNQNQRSFGRFEGAIFWTVLGAVVVALLIVVAKLLPKPPDPK